MTHSQNNSLFDPRDVARVDSLAAEFLRRYPDVMEAADYLVGCNGRDNLAWPPWCWLPKSGFQSICKWYCDVAPPYRSREAARVCALLQWQLGRGVYTPSPHVAMAIRTKMIDSSGISALTGDTWHRLKLPPVESWVPRMPEWCCYVVLPEPARSHTLDMRPLGMFNTLGTFVHLEYRTKTGRPELALLIDSDGTWDGLLPVPIYLDRNDLGTAIADAEENSMAAELHESVDADIRSLGGPTMIGEYWGLRSALVLPLALALIDADAGFTEPDSAHPPRRAEPQDGLWAPAARTHTWRITYR
jgi:hypothetical protein